VTLAELNGLPTEAATEAFARCCGARRWAMAMAKARPFADPGALLAEADRQWKETGPDDWHQAFSHHPRIGEQALRERFGASADWSEGEQAGVTGAGEDVLSALAEGNRAYEERFGFIFLVCATGKSASEMLALQRARMANDPETELTVAAAEQAKITRIRLEKLLAET
jgi:2-oxo-4-hydroxy-4-carboxy-5-ureidoimidazoline decarboxylase